MKFDNPTEIKIISDLLNISSKGKYYQYEKPALDLIAQFFLYKQETIPYSLTAYTTATGMGESVFWNKYGKMDFDEIVKGDEKIIL